MKHLALLLICTASLAACSTMKADFERSQRPAAAFEGDLNRCHSQSWPASNPATTDRMVAGGMIGLAAGAILGIPIAGAWGGANVAVGTSGDDTFSMGNIQIYKQRTRDCMTNKGWVLLDD